MASPHPPRILPSATAAPQAPSPNGGAPATPSTHAPMASPHSIPPLPPSPPAVVIDAAAAPPAHMATYRGPISIPIPAGACGAILRGQVWVLPCHDPGVVDYQRAAAATAAVRRRRRVTEERGAAAVVLGCLVGSVAEIRRPRQGRRGV